MKLVFLLVFIFWVVFWIIPREALPATGCAYPGSLDTFTNVSSGTILTAADYNKLLCAVEKLESELKIPSFTVATRPASPQLGRVIYVTDAIDATTCDTGGGTAIHVCVYNGTNWIATATGGGGGAPTGANYITRTSDGTLSAEFALGSLATGLLKNTTGTGIPTIAVQGTDYYAPGGTDVAIADGGTGASTQVGAQTTLGLLPGTNVFTQRTFQNHTGVFTWTSNADGVAGNPTPRVANSLIDGSNRFAADAGTGDAYAACPQSISTMSTPAYVDGSIHGFITTTANTDAATIDFCGLGARALVKLIGGVSTALTTGDIVAGAGGQPVLTMYNASANNFKIISPIASGGGGAGTPGGSTNQVQVNIGGVFTGDADYTFDPATSRVAATGGFAAGTCTTNCTTQNNTATGLRTATWAISADYDIAGTTGTKTSGDATKFDTSGRIVRGGTAIRQAQFMLGADDGAVLVDTNDQPTIFYNHYGQGITITSIFCETDTGTSTINLQRDDGSPASIASSNLVCSTSGVTTTTFSGTENQIASTQRVDLAVVTAATSGTPHRVFVSFAYTLD